MIVLLTNTYDTGGKVDTIVGNGEVGLRGWFEIMSGQLVDLLGIRC